MIETGRVIMLRRPPVLSMTAEPFVPERHSLEEVDQRWAVAQAENPRLFDGDCLHVHGVHRNGCGGAVLHIRPCSYRFYAVQRGGFDVGMRGLGVKGLISDARRRYLLGKRTAGVAFYEHHWEFAPGGAVEPDRDPADVVTAELVEETALTPACEPVAVALVYDPEARCWEIVYRIPRVAGNPQSSDEYSEVGWFDADNLPQPLSPIATQMTALMV